jgi:lipopolysaccharide transport system permease protein
MSPATERLTRIAAPTGWPRPDLRELWHYRELLLLLAWRDVAVRYKQTFLGVAWAVVRPMLMMAVFSVVLGRFASGTSDALPYPLFVLAGLLAWNFFAAVLTSASDSVIGAERLISKVYFPRLAVPLAAVGPAVVDLGIATGLLALMAGIYAVAGWSVIPGPMILLAPVFVSLLLLAAAGMGTLFAALSVTYRDVRVIVPFLVQLGLFATPAIFLTTSGGWLAALNPINGLVAGFRASLLGGEIAWGAVAFFALGTMVFRYLEDGFADTI